MIKLITYLLFAALFMLMPAGCSNDEPSPQPSGQEEADAAVEQVSQFPPLEEMCGKDIWEAQEVSYFGSNGQEFKNDDYICEVGKYYGKALSIQGDCLYEYTDAKSTLGDGWFSSIYRYTFDRSTGNVYLSGATSPYARVMSYDAETCTMIIHCNFDTYIPKSKLDGCEGDKSGYDIGSYGRMVMRPVSDKDAIDAFKNALCVKDAR